MSLTEEIARAMAQPANDVAKLALRLLAAEEEIRRLRERCSTESFSISKVRESEHDGKRHIWLSSPIGGMYHVVPYQSPKTGHLQEIRLHVVHRHFEPEPGIVLDWLTLSPTKDGAP